MAETKGGQDMTLAIIAFTFLLGIFGVLYIVATKMASSSIKEQNQQEDGERRRRGARGSADDDDEAEEDQRGGVRHAKRDAQKEQKRQERKAQVQADREARENRSTVKSEKEQKYNQKLLEKEAERFKKEEQEDKVRAAKEKQEKAEFEKWRGLIAPDEVYDLEDMSNDPVAMDLFIEHVKARKTVYVEELAAKFKMKTDTAIARLGALEKSGRLQGIFDDRGNYLYISKEELQSVVEWLQQKDKINKAEIVVECNKLIKANPTEEDVAKLQKETDDANAALEAFLKK